jgi:hypothetical protein
MKKVIGLTAAGCTVIGLAGCGSSQPATGSAQWTAACTSIATITIPWGGATDTLPLTSYGYDAIATDAQRLDAARSAGDDQGAATAMTQFNVDLANTNLNTCP